jgi:hypothetical protein
MGVETGEGMMRSPGLRSFRTVRMGRDARLRKAAGAGL